jgi:hypothetical protein
MKRFIISMIFIAFVLLSFVPIKNNTLAHHQVVRPAYYKWSTELCFKTGQYDPKKYTKDQLNNTYDIWMTFSGAALSTPVFIKTKEDISRFDLEKLKGEYLEKKELYNRPIVNSPYWKKIKAGRLQELEDEYQLAKISMEAYTNPKVLLDDKFSTNCTEYVQALTAKDTVSLLSAWSKLVEQQKTKNSSPERLTQNYLNQYNSKDRLFYARRELMTFGWWNCANDKTYRLNNDDTMEREFDKLFIKIKKDCMEP